MAERQITVYANPYCALDGDGQPHGVVQMINAEGYGLADRWVGAVREHEASVAADRHLFTFLKDEKGLPVAVKVPFVAHSAGYYAKKVTEGELIASDWPSAQACGLSKDEFKAGLAQLEVERGIAAAKHVAAYGEEARPDWAPAGDLPVLSASTGNGPPPVEAPPAPAKKTLPAPPVPSAPSEASK